MPSCQEVETSRSPPLQARARVGKERKGQEEKEHLQKTWKKNKIINNSPRSHASHSGCCAVGGRRGQETGGQFTLRIMRSASKKLRKRDATRRSCRKRRWNWTRKNKRKRKRDVVILLCESQRKKRIKQNQTKSNKMKQNETKSKTYLLSWKNIPCNGVRNGSKDPIQLTQWCLAIRNTTRNTIQHVWCDTMCA